MTAAWENFITSFHNIEGIRIGERQRNLQKLLRNTSLTVEEQQLVVNNLKPKTYSENLWYIDTLLCFKQINQLLEILKHGQEGFVGKLLKHQWFLKEVFSNVSAKELVDDYLPFMSFSVKMKLLKKLSGIFDEEKIDNIFDCVLQRYGLSMATTVLQGCSLQKITDALKNYDVNLKFNQLRIIYSKEPKLIHIYFDEYKQELNKNDRFLVFLAQKDLDFFWELIEKHNFSNDLKLGRRTTKKAIDAKKQKIILEPKKYVKYLRYERLVRVLNKQDAFKQLYHDLFPSDLEIFDENLLCNKLLKYYPKHLQYNLFTETFSEVTKQNIWSNANYLNDYFLELIVDKDIRDKWAQLKYRESNNNKYIQYYNTEKCIALIKEKINLTSDIKARKQLLCLLVKSCALNKDLTSLEEVLKYFCMRHRNEHGTVLNGFLDTVEEIIELERLTETHWKYLSEILKIHGCNKTFRVFNAKLKIKYVEYLYQNSGPEEEINNTIKDFAKDHVSNYCFTIPEIKDAEIEKKILLKLVDHIPSDLELTHIIYSCIDFLHIIFAYNVKNPANIINIFDSEKLRQLLKTLLEKNFYHQNFEKLFLKEICKAKRNRFDNELLTLYWEHITERHFGNRVILWYLKHEPSMVVENFEKIFKACVKQICDYIGTLTKIKLYSHLNLDDMVIKCSLKMLDEDEKDAAITVLSIFCSPEKYIDLITNRNLIPTSPKVDMLNTEARNIYEEQQKFIKGFKNIKDPLRYLSFLIDTFCQGDYLKSSLSSLHSAFHKCPENELKFCLDKFSKHNAMTMKKLAISLSYVFDQQTVLQTLQRFEGDKNISLQKFMCLTSLKYFSHNPTEQIYEKVVYFIGLLKGNDNESLLKLPTANIPRHFKPRYIQNTWTLLETLKNNDEKLNTLEFYKILSSFLNLVDSTCIKKLPQNFCKQIIQKYFLTNVKSTEFPAIVPFVIKYLMYCDEQTENFNFVFQLLSTYKSQFWNGDSSVKARKTIYDFFEAVYEEASNKDVKSNFIDLFYSHWSNTFTPIDAFDEHVKLNYLQFKRDSKEDLGELSKRIVLFSEQINADFGVIVFPKFSWAIAQSLGHMKEERVSLLSHMLKFKTTSLNCILVIELIKLQSNLFYEGKIRSMYREIDSVLKQMTDPNVQLYYNLYLKQ